MEDILSFLSFKMGGKLAFHGNLGNKDTTKHDIMEDFPQELIKIWLDFDFRNSSLSETRLL